MSIVIKFWHLASSERREIMLELGLIQDADLSLPEQERYSLAFKRCGERGLTEKLIALIESY